MRHLSILGLLISVITVSAQPPAEYNTGWLAEPYQLMMVVHADPHPLLTNVFVEQFTREVGDSLQRDLGRTAKVSTIIYRDTGERSSDAARQMMESVIERGWTELDNLPKQINPNKVHLVRLFYVDGEYEVQSRQVDGDTSIVSPLRKSRTSDRQWVTRQAALQIAQDFGHVGEIIEVNNQTLKIKMRAAGLGVPETIRMAQGEVMALAQVRRNADNYTANRLQETIAYITNVDAVKGEVTARLYSRLQTPLNRDRQTIAFRAIKLGTRVTPLHLRVLDQDNNPINGYSVSYFPSGYENGGAEPLGTTDPQGKVSSKDPINHVAFVRVQIAGVGKTDAPLPLLDDQPIVIKISGNREAAILDDTKHEYDRWMKKYNQIVGDFEVDYKLLYIDVYKKGDEKKAVDNLQKLAAKVKESVDELTTELERVRKVAGTNRDAAKIVEHAEKSLKALAASVKQMEEAVELERNPTEDRKAYKLAMQAEAEFDFDEAIKQYKVSLSKNRNQPKLIEKLKALEYVWRTQYRDNDHKEARAFAINVWGPKAKGLTWEQLSRDITKAEQYLDDLERRGDYLTVLIMIRGDLRHIRTLNSALESLGNAEENQEKVQIVEKTRKSLIDFDRRAQDFVSKARNDEIK